MRARCPNCKTLFRVAIEQLDLAEGLVRCGQCLCVFQARADSRGADQTLHAGSPLPEPASERETPSAKTDTDPFFQITPDQFDDLPPPAPDSGTEAALPIVRASRVETDEPTDRPGRAPTIAGDPMSGRPTKLQPPEVSASAADEDRPELLLHGLTAARETPPRPTWARTLILSANVLLCLLLVGQLAWYERASLARVDWLQPALSAACELFDCRIPERRDLDSIQLLDRSVSSHPSVDAALIISATMVNNAAFKQAYPLLMVSMSDIRGQIVARRHFRPEEYLDPKSAADGMVPGAPVAVVLEVTDPGGDALTFELEFF